MPTTTAGRLDRPSETSKTTLTLEARRGSAINQLTAGLPASLKRRVKKMVKDMPDPALVLEHEISLLISTQNDYIKAHAADVAKYKRNVAKAKKLRKDKPEDQQAKAEARGLENNRPNYIGAAKVIADLSDKIRRLGDSLAMHRPTGYSRVILEMRTGGDGSEPWAAPIWDNLSTTLDDNDEELIRKCNGDTSTNG